MIDVRALTFRYGREGAIFEDFSWSVGAGELWAVIGASGCGKSTLLYLLAGLVPSPSRSILVSGEPVTRPRPGTGLILQDHGLLPWATVRENARLGLDIRRLYGPDGLHAPRDEGLDRGESEHRVEHWLSRLGIDGLADRYPAQLSGGQRQRAAIARTLAMSPDLLLMDEPFSALDAPTREDMQNLVAALRHEAGRGGDLTTVAVTHNIEEAVFLGENILVLGPPPNRALRVLSNAGAGGEGYRRDPAFLEKIEEVRSLMGNIRDDTL